MLTTRKWSGTWISAEAGWIDIGRDMLKFPVKPAPYFRKRFTLDATPASAVLYLATAGWHELYVNGVKADDRVLAPCVSQFDVHVNYLEYDLTALLKSGDNAITVLQGNGLFNAQTSEVWNFIHAPWRDFPRMCCDLVVDGRLCLKSDHSWKMAPSPVVFDSMRSGETYDFGKEIPGVFDADFDDSAWAQAFPGRPPAGTLIREEMEPCRVCERTDVVERRQLDGETILFDMGRNVTGWAEVEVELSEEQKEPLELMMEFGERLNPDGTADRRNIACFSENGWEAQIGRMILTPGRRSFVWRPHFTYFGYRYIHLHCKMLANVAIRRVQALFIHNDFASVGNFTSSSADLNQLQEVIRRSFLTNFTGIPTDCPHREKNGWTGDHNLAMDTALWNYDAMKGYKNFLQIFVDTQRPSGELAPIAPSGQWWWNCGPAWDYVLWQGAWEAWRFYGDDSVIREHYDAMRRYLEFTEVMKVDGLPEYGLGDWCPVDDERMASTRLTSSAWVYSMHQRFAVFAEMLGRKEDAVIARRRAAELRTNIRKEFIHSDGTVDKEQWSSLACVVYFKLCDEVQVSSLVERLVKKLRDNRHKVDFGIFGSQWIPRVLGDYGYAEDVVKMLLQPEFPGYVYMLRQGASTLWETWKGDASLDHIMFGDPSAWCFEYLAGIRPQFDGPGFTQVKLTPCVVPQLDFFQAKHVLPNGKILKAGWYREQGGVLYRVSIPEGTKATLVLPGKAPREIPAGETEIGLE